MTLCKDLRVGDIVVGNNGVNNSWNGKNKIYEIISICDNFNNGSFKLIKIENNIHGYLLNQIDTWALSPDGDFFNIIQSSGNITKLSKLINDIYMKEKNK